MKRICANCEYNDGNVYTANPPMYKCKFTGDFNHGFKECDIEFTPIKKGHWENKYNKFFCTELPCCSACGKFQPIRTPYCPDCGAKMEEKE